MIQRMMASALFAGIAAGLFAALLHFAFVQKYLLLGEQYESGASVHFAGAAGAANDAATSAMNEPDSTEARPEGNAQDAAVVPTGTFERNAWTALFFGVLYLSYGLLLVAGMALARRFGQRVTPSDGILWGIAGFASLQLAPALGLAPNLPGIAAAELADRQLWWAATAMATATGLALIAYGRRPLWIGLAVVLLALPHLVGAPDPGGFSGVAPPEVAAAFAARTLGVGLAGWTLLGWLAGWYGNRAERS